MYEIFDNAFNAFTQGNGALDHEWPECLGCAAIERSWRKSEWNGLSNASSASRGIAGTERTIGDLGSELTTDSWVELCGMEFDKLDLRGQYCCGTV
jgi:hypothetical protein